MAFRVFNKPNRWNEAPTKQVLQWNRYDRINAKRKYLSDVARAKRHFGFTKPVKKHSRKHKR